MKTISLIVLALSFCLRTAASGKGLESLPWSDLAEVVGDQLISATPQDYIDQCYYPEFTKWPRSSRTNHNLINQPSGLCVDFLFCGFKQCTPVVEFLNDEMSTTELLHRTFGFDFLDSPLDPNNNITGPLAMALEGWLDPSNPAYNLPPRVLFPRYAGDIVAAVDFAKTHGVEISVKNSGHSYAGSSTKANTLLINMNQYKRYASDDEESMGIIDCDGVDLNDDPQDLDAQLCRLLSARRKPAALRVGGGENFDKAYRSVKAMNEKVGYKYHMIGGAAGTVSPMGWTWQGGLAATTGGRMFGFGVDQVLQIEAVLPNGEHVRFGPTKWENDDGHVYPKTTEVSGVCNKNPLDDEVNWVWKACPDDTDVMFDDLWFAFRGGGGGTWGIVLSAYLQLHDYLPLVELRPSEACDAEMNNSDDNTLMRLTALFAIDYFLDPDVLGITREESNACGLDAGSSPGVFWCLAEDAPALGEKLISVFQNYIAKNSENLTDIGANCLVATNRLEYAEAFLIAEGPHAGKVQDTGKPMYRSPTSFEINHMVPKSWILKSNENKKILADFWTANPFSVYFAFGGDAEFAHDQTASLSEAHREAGAMVFYFVAPNEIPGMLSPWPDLLPEMFDFVPGKIPPYVGSNHLGPNTYGPLKEDLSIPCPIWNLTNIEAETACISAQEAVYGTVTLKRLESIKKTVDPSGMFDCFRCIGNKVLADGESPSTEVTFSPSEAEFISDVGETILNVVEAVEESVTGITSGTSGLVTQIMNEMLGTESPTPAPTVILPEETDVDKMIGKIADTVNTLVEGAGDAINEIYNESPTQGP